MRSAGVRAGGHRQRAAPGLAGAPRGGLVSLRIPFLDKFLIISPLFPSFYTKAVVPKCLCGPHPGGALWPLPSEVRNLPSTHRKIKAKSEFKARLCDRPKAVRKAEACLMKTLSLPGPLPLINERQGLRGMWDVRLEKLLLASGLTAPIPGAAPNKKEQIKYSWLGFISIRG